MPAPPTAPKHTSAPARANLVLFVLIAAYAVGYTVLTWQRYATFHAQIDMSYYLRLIWGIGHGRPDLPLVRARHFIGLHLEPIVFPLAGLSALGVRMAPLLLGLQSLAVAYLALPAYRLGARHLGPGAPALCAALCALLYPTVTVANLHDFHPVTLALAPLLGLVDALDEGAHRRALILGALALCCREDIALQLLCLCLVVPGAPRRIALLLAVALGLYFFLYVLWIQPRYIPSFGSYGLHFRIGGAARSARDLVGLALHEPGVILRHLISMDRPRYPFTLLWPLALLPLLAPRYLIGAAPIVIINLLSDFPRVRTIEAHYATAIVPFVLGAGIIGAGRSMAWLGKVAPALRPLPLVLFLCCAGAAHLTHGGSPLAVRGTRFYWDDYRDEPGAPLLRAALEQVPRDASVAARPGVLAHLAERPRSISPPEYDDGQPVDLVVRMPAGPPP